MSKLIIMQGLPASGKTTVAKRIVEKDGNTIRVNRDLLRKMLHFDKWTGQNEKITRLAERALVKELIKDRVVIIDDTNLNLGTLQSWIDFAKELKASYKICRMTTDILECIARDENRENSVGSDVIINMARSSGLYSYTKKDVIVDIDGTLADISHRKHFVENTDKKDWKSFFAGMDKDIPRRVVIRRVKELAKTHNIVLVSGRPDNYKEVTKAWLKKYKIPYETLIMRHSGDNRPDEVVKQDILEKYFDYDMVHLVIDDRPKVIRMWRQYGLEVEDVGNGVEF